MALRHNTLSGWIYPARFYDKNEDALADMKRLAEGEQNAC
jgi:hypothetical protein